MIMNVVGELAGGAHTDIQGCLPDAWKTQTEVSASNDSADQQVSQSSGVLQTIVNSLESVITQVCNFKDTIKGLLIQRYVKRSVLRMLLEKRGQKWGFLKKIAKAAKTVGKAVVKGAKTVAKAASAVVGKIVAVIKKVWAQFVSVVKAFFASPLMDTVKSVFTCVSGMQTAGEQVVNTIKGIIAKFQKIVAGNAVGIIDVLIDLVCNWQEFKAAIGFLTQAQGERVVVNKWGLIGKFIGKLLFAIGKTRRFRRFYLRLRLYKN
jgi:phage-related protein